MKKLPKLRLNQINNANLGVWKEPVNGSTGPCELVLQVITEEGDKIVQQMLASPMLINAAKKVLSWHIAEGNAHYKADIEELARAVRFAERDLKIDTILWRENEFDDSLRALSLEKGRAAPQTVKKFGAFRDILKRLFS